MGWLKGALTGLGVVAAGAGAVVLFGPVGVAMISVTAAGGGAVGGVAGNAVGAKIESLTEVGNIN